MKTSRLLAYAAIGIIAGLLLENKSLRFRNDVRRTTDDVKHRVSRATKKARKKLAHMNHH